MNYCEQNSSNNEKCDYIANTVTDFFDRGTNQWFIAFLVWKTIHGQNPVQVPISIPMGQEKPNIQYFAPVIPSSGGGGNDPQRYNCRQWGNEVDNLIGDTPSDNAGLNSKLAQRIASGYNEPMSELIWGVRNFVVNNLNINDFFEQCGHYPEHNALQKRFQRIKNFFATL